MRPGSGGPYGDEPDDPYSSGESLDEVVDRLFDPLTDPLPGAGHPGSGYPGQGYPDQAYQGQGYPGQGRPDQGGEPYPGADPYPGSDPYRGAEPYPSEPAPSGGSSPWFRPHLPPQGAGEAGHGSGEPADPLTDPSLSYRGPEPARYEPTPEPTGDWFRDQRSEPWSPSSGPYAEPGPTTGGAAADAFAGDRWATDPSAGDGYGGDPLAGEADLFGGADPLTAPLVGPGSPAEPESPRSRRFAHIDHPAGGPPSRSGPASGAPSGPEPHAEPHAEPRTERFPAMRSPADADRQAPAGTDRASGGDHTPDGPYGADTDPETRPVPGLALDDETVALRTTGEHGRPLRADAGPPLGEGRAARRRAQREGGRASTATEPVGTGRAARRRALKAAKPGPGVIASRVIGELFITCGVLMLLFVTYQLWWTNVLAQRHAAQAADHLQDQWEAGDGKDRDAGKFSAGEGFAIMYIPKLDVRVPIAEGISKPDVLDKGMLGHYSGQGMETAMPWDDLGNFAVAGHRNTHGEPFRYINKLVAGDAIVVETKDTFYTYEMANRLPSTLPSNIGVINPVPKESGFTEPGRYVTLTTCTPEFTSKYRLIVWGKMVDESPRSEGKPDALVD